LDIHEFSALAQHKRDGDGGTVRGAPEQGLYARWRLEFLYFQF
jgi:hypothetical protein